MGVTIELYRCCIGVFNTYFSKTKSKSSNQLTTGNECSWSSTIAMFLALILSLNISIILSMYFSASDISARASSSRLQVDHPVKVCQKTFLHYSKPRGNQSPPWLTPPAPPWSGSFTPPRRSYSPPPWPWPRSSSPSYSSHSMLTGEYIPHLPSTALTWSILSQQKCLSKNTSTFPPEILNRSPSSPLHCRILSLFSMVTNFQSRYTIGNRKNRGIKISHWNKGGSFLINRMTEIKNVIAQHQPQILGISEANLLNVHDPCLAAIQDYNLHVCPTISNPTLRKSRIVVYTHKNIIAKLRPDLMSDMYSSIWLEVGLPNHKRFLVSQSYREWQYTNQNGDKSSSTIPEQLSRWLIFLEQWETALGTGMEVHCLGDMNLNHCNWTDTNLPRTNQTYKLRDLVSALFSRIIPLGVSQHISGATRHFPGQVSTGLDHYYTNQPSKLTQVEKHYCGGSDHMMVSGIRRSRSFKSSPKYLRKRSYKNFDHQLFVNAVKQISWLDLYLCEGVDEAVELFTEKITNILDVMAPMKTFQVRTKYAPWLSKETLEIIKERNEAQKVAAETKSRDDWVRYKQIRNKVTNRLKYEESNWRQARFEACAKNSSKTWKNVKQVLNWQSSGSPSKLFYKGALKTKSQDIADSQNEFFIEKVQNIRLNMSPPISDPLSKLQSLMEGRQCAFSLSMVYPKEVDSIISSLTNTTAFGFDLIDTSIIKLIKPEILPAVTHIINLSIKSSKFPTSWKKSKIIPLHKKDDPLDPKNYRPVAIVPILSKVLERAIFNQLVAYLDKNNLIHPNHHAYRPGHNTTTALIQMYDGWLRAVDSGKLVGACLLDMSAAFDLVDHDLLLDKLSLYGLDDSSKGWIRSYLSGRTQSVSIEGTLSKLLPVHTGVPQGSILGPLLYTVFTNELPEIVHDNPAGLDERDEDAQPGPAYHEEGSDSAICCYADDTTVSISSDNPATLSAKLSDNYKLVAQFMVDNRLKLNDDKTHLLVMGTASEQTRAQISIRAATEEISPTPSEKLLGCWVHQDLHWTEYIRGNPDSLLRSLSSRVTAVKKIRYLANFRNRKMIAEGVFMSKLSYVIALWGGCGSGLKKTLQVLQNKVAQVVTRKDWTTSSKVLLQQCGWLSVNQLIFYHTVLLVFKVRQSKSPNYIYRMHNSWLYPYTTRQAENGVIRVGIRARLEVVKNSFRWRAASSFNQLPVEIRTCSKVESFKRKVKPWIINNISL